MVTRGAKPGPSAQVVHFEAGVIGHHPQIRPLRMEGASFDSRVSEIGFACLLGIQSEAQRSWRQELDIPGAELAEDLPEFFQLVSVIRCNQNGTC